MLVHVAFEIFRNRRWHRDEKSVFQFDLFFLRLDASKRRRRRNRRRREKQKRSDDEEERREKRTTTQRASKKKHDDDDEMGGVIFARAVFVKKIARDHKIYITVLMNKRGGSIIIIVRRFRYSQRFSPDPRFPRLPHDTAPNAFSLESKPERANGTTGRTVIRLCACLRTAPSDLEAPCTARASSRRIACRKIRRFLVDV